MAAAQRQWWLSNHWIHYTVEYGWRVRCVLPNLYMRLEHTFLHQRWTKSLLGHAFQIPSNRCELPRQFASFANCEDSCGCGSRCACSSDPGISIKDSDNYQMEPTDLTRRSSCRVLQCVFYSCRWCPNAFRTSNRPF